MNTPRPITEEMNVHQDWYARARVMKLNQLQAFLKELTEDYGHDYGTICHAIAAAAIAAAFAVNATPQAGITGFQASCVMWEFLKRWSHIDGPAWLMEGKELLYPQNRDKFRTISPATWAWLRDEAAKSLAGSPHAADAVKAHWREIMAGVVPFGLRVLA